MKERKAVMTKNQIVWELLKECHIYVDTVEYPETEETRRNSEYLRARAEFFMALAKAWLKR